MRFALLLVSPLFFLAGCPDETVIVDPPASHQKAPKLASGEYGVLVVGVTRAECDGLREQDVWGMKLPMSLRVNGTSNVADLAGFQLFGEFKRGNLLLEADGAPVVKTTSDEDHQDEPDDGDDTRAASSTEGGEGEDREECSDCDDSGDREDRDDRDEPDDDVDHGERPEEMFIALDLRVSSTRDASGVFVYEARGCSIEAQVVVHRFEDDGAKPEPMPVEEGEEEPEEGEESSPCAGGGSDCG